MLHRPKFLILDEPTNGLDPAGIREFRDYLRLIAKTENVSVFVSSHMLSEIELMCDRIAVIQNGKLVDMRDMSETQEAHYYVEALPADQTVELLGSLGFQTQSIGEGFVIKAEKTQIPGLIKALAAAGIELYAIQPHRKTLEDQFLELTGGGQLAETASK